MKFSLYSKKNQLDEMQEQTMRKIESHGFWLLWGSLLAAWIVQTVFGAADKAAGEWVMTGEVLSVMRKLAEEGMTMLVVTHEMGFARNVSSKTVFMENGVVVEQAPSHEFFAAPKEERTRAFLQKIAHTE